MYITIDTNIRVHFRNCNELKSVQCLMKRYFTFGISNKISLDNRKCIYVFEYRVDI